jgi:hypothetical protein
VIAIIDADIVIHRVGYTTENDEEWIARHRADEMLDGILVDTSATNFELWISDDRDKNFRFQVSPTYKAQRTAPRPKHYDFIKGHVIKEWDARIAHDMEADDAMGISQDKSGGETVICSIDKDLLQIPGQHYNFVKKEWESVTAWEGLKWFYKQLLIGDVSDNVKGCSGIGPVKAAKALDPVLEETGEIGLFNQVFSLYLKAQKGQSPQDSLKQLVLAGQLLKIKQRENETLWDFPLSRLMQVYEWSSTPRLVVEAIQSMVLTMPVTTTGGFPSHGQPKETTSKESLPA